MRVAIMQPYFFPYLGYFQLIQSVDRFVIYDDVNFIKGGWINRNFILGRSGPQRITLQLSGASPNKHINQIQVGTNGRKLLMTITQAYTRAPRVMEISRLMESCLLQSQKNLATYLEVTLREACTFLDLETEILLSSQIEKDNSLRGAEKVIAICRALGADTYINSIGGLQLYDRQQFKDAGLELRFIQTGRVSYPQLRPDFVPNLSIIDLMMFNERQELRGLLQEYALV